MIFKRPTHIKKAVANVHAERCVLHANKRGHIWKVKRALKLYNSLVYLAGAFLFWLGEPKNVYNCYCCARDPAQTPNVSVNGGAGCIALVALSSETGPEERF